MISVGEKINILRTVTKWSRKKLSEKSGVHRETLNAIENGKTQNPGYRTLESIANAFGLSYAEFVSDDLDTLVEKVKVKQQEQIDTRTMQQTG